MLDNRDSELRSQQAELKKKLMELQNKKEQVDQLVMQLQVMDEDNHSDVGKISKYILKPINNKLFYYYYRNASSEYSYDERSAYKTERHAGNSE